MKKDSEKDELRGEYDLSKLGGRVRGKYTDRYNAGTNLVLLDEDVAESFPTPRAVNDALRELIRTGQTKGSVTK